jgi:hypothetical protein
VCHRAAPLVSVAPASSRANIDGLCTVPQRCLQQNGQPERRRACRSIQRRLWIILFHINNLALLMLIAGRRFPPVLPLVNRLVQHCSNARTAEARRAMLASIPQQRTRMQGPTLPASLWQRCQPYRWAAQDVPRRTGPHVLDHFGGVTVKGPLYKRGDIVHGVVITLTIQSEES